MKGGVYRMLTNELYSCHALQLKRIYISAFILLLAAISYLIITVDKRQSPIPLVTEPGLSYFGFRF